MKAVVHVKAGRRQLLIVGGLIGSGVLVLLLGALLVVLPQKSKTHDLEKQMADVQRQFVTLHAVPRAGGAARPPAAELFKLARAMPDHADTPGIVLALVRAAAGAHVDITSITPSAAIAQPDGSAALPMHVLVSGKWTAIAAFLRTLRRSVRTSGRNVHVDGRLFVVDSVDLATGTPGAELQATLAVNAFTYGTAPPVVTTSSTDGTTTTPAPATSGSTQAVAAGSGS